LKKNIRILKEAVYLFFINNHFKTERYESANF
jgi:hypothetical protein